MKTASDLPTISPALTFTTGSQPAFLTFSIRGVSSYVYRIGIQPAVSVVVDGIPYARASEYAGDLGDIERAEVLSGPQGTLFGRNSTGGAVNIVRKTPGNDFEGYAAGDVLIGHHDDVETFVRGAINAPLTERARLRVFAFNRYNSDYIENYHPTAKDDGKHNSYGIQGKLALDLGDNIDVLIGGDYTHMYDRNGDPQVFIPLQSYQVPAVPNITQKQIALQGGATGDRFGINNYRPWSGTTITRGALLDINLRATDQLSIRSLTSYRKAGIKYLTAFYPFQASIFDPQGFDLLSSLTTPSINRGSPYSRKTDWHYFTQEVRALYSTELVDAVVGVFYNNLREKELSEQPRFLSATAAGRPAVDPTFPYFYSNNFTDTADRNKVLAGFGDVTIHPAEGLDIFAGYRYSHETLDYAYRRISYPNTGVVRGVNFDPVALTPLANVPFTTLIFSGEHSENDWAGRVGASYEVVPRTTVYGTFSRGYVGAGFDAGNGSTGTPANPERALLRPSITKNYEIGFKSELFDRRLRLNVSVFKANTRDVQVSALIPGTNFNIIQNAGDIKAKGVEVNAQARLARNFDIMAGLAYLHADFDNLTQPCYPNQLVTGTGCVAGRQDVSGMPALNAPRWKLNITPTYQIEMPGLFDVILSGDYQYKSKVFYQLDHDPLAVQGGYSLINLSVGVVTKDRRSELRLFVNNLTDKYFCNNVVNGPIARQECQSTSISAQRRFGLSGKFGF